MKFFHPFLIICFFPYLLLPCLAFVKFRKSMTDVEWILEQGLFNRTGNTSAAHLEPKNYESDPWKVTAYPAIFHIPIGSCNTPDSVCSLQCAACSFMTGPLHMGWELSSFVSSILLRIYLSSAFLYCFLLLLGRCLVPALWLVCWQVMP